MAGRCHMAVAAIAVILLYFAIFRYRELNMVMRAWKCGAAAIAIGLLGLFGAPTLAQPIGSVIELNRDAYGTPPGGQADLLGLGGDVVSDELVQTLAQASTRIRFLDDSDLRVGESSMVVLDRLIYDPDQGTGEFVLGIAVGTMRFVSGDLPPEQVVIETPVAVIGIRGTDFVVTVAQSGRTTVAVLEGQVIVAPFGGNPVLASPGQTAVVGPTRGQPAIVQAGLIVPPDPGLGDIPDESELDTDHAEGRDGAGGAVDDGNLARDTAVPVAPAHRVVDHVGAAGRNLARDTAVPVAPVPNPGAIPPPPPPVHVDTPGAR